MKVYYYKGNYKAVRQKLLNKAWEDFKPGEPMPEIYKDSSNKPYFINHEAFISLSHQGEYFAIALSSHPIGIDIQGVNKKANIKKIAKRFFPDLLNVDEEEFYKTWVKREALGKLTGEGFFLKDRKQNHVFYNEFMIDEKIYGATASKVKGEIWIKELK